LRHYIIQNKRKSEGSLLFSIEEIFEFSQGRVCEMNAQAMMWPGYEKVFPQDFQEKQKRKGISSEKVPIAGPDGLSFARVLLGREFWREREEEKKEIPPEVAISEKRGASLFLFEYERFLDETAETREGMLRFCGEWSVRFLEASATY